MSFAASTNPVVSNLSGARDVQVVDAGALFVAVNPTPGTGIVGPVSTTFDEAKALMTVYNSGTRTIYPLALQLYVTVVGTTGTRCDYTHTIDTGNRYSSGGSALSKANANMASSAASDAVINFGALVTTAASGNRRLLGNHQLREAAIEIVGDFYEFTFGGASGSQAGSRAATVADFQRSLPAIAVGPNQTYTLHFWRAAITVGITYEVNFVYAEK